MAGIGQTNIDSANSISLPGASPVDMSVTTDTGMTKLPDTAVTKSTVTKTGTKQTLSDVVSGVASKGSELVGSYGNIVNKVQQITGVSLPNASSIAGVSKVLSGLNFANDLNSTVNSATSFNSFQNAFRTQVDNSNPQSGAFKWVEEESTPMDFVSYDSVLLFVGEPLYADNPKGQLFKPIGLCEQFNISTSVQVTTLQELRCEEQIVLPGKSQPVMIAMSRLCGKWSNLLNRLHNVESGWNMSTQYPGARRLFGLYGIVMDTSRRNVVHNFYVERCSIESLSMGISAGQMQVIESCTIKAGRIIDPNYVPTVKTTLATGTEDNSNSEKETTTSANTTTIVTNEDIGNLPTTTLSSNEIQGGMIELDAPKI